MKSVQLKVARIGNSRRVEAKLPWKDTADAMAEAREGWSEWDRVASDGLREIAWGAKRPRRRPSTSDQGDVR
jgi:hypothetical protein